jgi:predicted Zn-dependent protease
VNLRHISSRIDYSQKVGIGTLAGVVAGILLGIGGAGAVAGAMTAGSMAAGQSMNLAYTRENEIQADQIGLQYINSAGYSCYGLVSSFSKMRAKQWFGPNQIPTYLNTHPAGDERMSYIKAWIEQKEKGKKFVGSSDPDSFKRIRARISGLYGDQNLVIKKFESRLESDPSDDSSVYGMAMAYWRLGENEKAMERMRLLIKKNAFDPVYMRDTGIIQFSMGDMDSAIAALGNSGAKSNDTLRLLYLGRALMANGSDTEAEKILSTLIKDKKDFADGYYYMAEVSQRKGRDGLSHYYLGVNESMTGRPKQAVFHLKKAMPYLDGYPDLKKNAEILLKQAFKDMKKEMDENNSKDSRDSRDDDLQLFH